MMEQKNKIIPEIRFPEFVHDGEWKIAELSKLTDIYKGEQLNRIELTDNGKYPCQNGGVNASGYTDKYNCEENTITISEGGNSCGYVNFMSTKFWLGGHCYKLVLKNGINNYFLYQVLKFNEENIMRLRVGSGLPNIQMKSLREFEISITESLKEQQKIADCLSSLDEAITAHIDKLEALKNYKKGLLQNLFPQEGQKVPNYRFPEFVNDGNWEKDSLGNVTNYFKGFAFQSKEYSKSGRRIVRVSDMGYDYIKDNVGAIFIRESLATQYKKWELKENDVIITTVGSKPPIYDSLVGRSIIVNSKDDKSLLNQNAVCLRANVNIEQSFLNLLFKKKEYVTFIESIIRGNANQGSITLEDLFKYSFLKPSNPKEQKKIAECFSAVENLMIAQTEKVELLKTHKKGLMQGLFPKVKN